MNRPVIFFFFWVTVWWSAFKLYFMVTPLITPWKRKHTQALIMQQDCTWIVVPLIWYRVIPPCWCTSPVWIPFGSPAPKLDLHSPQGVSVLINVAGPNIQELIQLWSDHYHVCLTLRLHFVHPVLLSPQESVCSVTLHLKVSHVWCWRSACDADVTSSDQCEEWKPVTRSFTYEEGNRGVSCCENSVTCLNQCNQNLSDLYRYLRQIWHQNITRFSKPASAWRTKIGKRNSDRLITEVLNKMMELYQVYEVTRIFPYRPSDNTQTTGQVTERLLVEGSHCSSLQHLVWISLSCILLLSASVLFWVMIYSHAVLLLKYCLVLLCLKHFVSSVACLLLQLM